MSSEVCTRQDEPLPATANSMPMAVHLTQSRVWPHRSHKGQQNSSMGTFSSSEHCPKRPRQRISPEAAPGPRQNHTPEPHSGRRTDGRAAEATAAGAATSG
ncbi:unnamed protein product [Prorocentrum cordatum]|uniref:Uncharacterized protein n=1 Tax=Prorocentrum cordatum TaxID=2364126 RepID=A0ABN9WTA8_9DINO|nr:unnamed protein product [Polarella glacialis]